MLFIGMFFTYNANFSLNFIRRLACSYVKLIQKIFCNIKIFHNEYVKAITTLIKQKFTSTVIFMYVKLYFKMNF